MARVSQPTPTELADVLDRTDIHNLPIDSQVLYEGTTRRTLSRPYADTNGLWWVVISPGLHVQLYAVKVLMPGDQ